MSQTGWMRGILFSERTRREPQRALAAIGDETLSNTTSELGRAAAPTEAELGYAVDVALEQMDTNEDASGG